MMGKRITKIQMTNFRGAVGNFELDFDSGKDLTILFGENGSGKSSILDAIDVICNGSTGSLEGVSIGAASGKYLCSLGTQPVSLKVTVHSNSENWTGTMNRNNINVIGSIEKPKVNVLRRNKILDLVLAQPSARYEALRHFIDIEVVEQSENTLAQKLKDTDRGLKEIDGTKVRLAGQLNELWETEGRPGPGVSAMEWAQNKTNTGITELNIQLEMFKVIVAALKSVTSANSNYAMRVNTYADLESQLKDVTSQIKNSPSMNGDSTIKLLESLEKAKIYIESEQGLTQCPTCNRPMEREELLIIVTQAITQLSQLKILSDRRRDIQGKLTIAESHLKEAQQTLMDSLKAISEKISQANIPELTGLKITWPNWENPSLDMASLIRICSQLESVQSALDAQLENVQRDVNQFNLIKQSWRGIQESDEKLAELTRIQDGLQRAHGIVHDQRIKFTQNILNGISTEANRLFQVIHPGENIGLEDLKMDEDRRSSVHQTGKFYEHSEIPPQAVFSESHLDTLGFCVWLALAKKESPQTTILLIDDIFTSLDSKHLNRIVDLLTDERKKFCQVILATHYRSLCDKYRLGLAANTSVQLIELSSKWSPETGIRAKKFLPEVSELRSMLSDGFTERQALASKTGVLLEAVFSQITMQYACCVARDPYNEPTLVPLLNGASSLLKDKLKISISTVDSSGNASLRTITAKDTFTALRECIYIRNQVGCHYNEAGIALSDSDVEEFVNKTLAFMDVIMCPQCGGMATRLKSDKSAYECSCKTIEMTPLRA